LLFNFPLTDQLKRGSGFFREEDLESPERLQIPLNEFGERLGLADVGRTAGVKETEADELGDERLDSFGLRRFVDHTAERLFARCQQHTG
jgi:hypothetical protein